MRSSVTRCRAPSFGSGQFICIAWLQYPKEQSPARSGVFGHPRQSCRMIRTWRFSDLGEIGMAPESAVVSGRRRMQTPDATRHPGARRPQGGPTLWNREARLPGHAWEAVRHWQAAAGYWLCLHSRGVPGRSSSSLARERLVSPAQQGLGDTGRRAPLGMWVRRRNVQGAGSA